MAKICIIVLCGIPGSGKTCLSRKLGSPSEVADQNFDSCQTQKGSVSDSGRNFEGLMIKPPSIIHHVCYDHFIPANIEQRLIEEAPSVSLLLYPAGISGSVVVLWSYFPTPANTYQKYDQRTNSVSTVP